MRLAHEHWEDLFGVQKALWRKMRLLTHEQNGDYMSFVVFSGTIMLEDGVIYAWTGGGFEVVWYVPLLSLG